MPEKPAEAKPLITHGSLFAGIGGFDLGFERAGIKTVWQVEIDPFCRKVLEKHWPEVKRYGDIRDCRDMPHVDIVSGGFPCQPVSLAGKRRAQSDKRWLWGDFERAVCDLRPRFVVVENVPGLFTAGFGDVMGGLAALGLSAEWAVFSACEFGAPHTRERVFVVAYPPCESRRWKCGRIFQQKDGNEKRDLRQWIVESQPVRVAHGIPNRLDRNSALGNAVAPHIAEWIGRRIVENFNA